MTNVEKLAESLEAQAERTAADAPEYSTCIRIVARQIREAIEADREGREGYEERWVVPEAALKGHMLRGPCPAEGWVKIYVPANVEKTWRTPVAASPEPDKETP